MYNFKSKYNIKSFIRTSAYLLICTLIISCAQVVAPGGGKKDITPPKVVKYIPDSATINFNARSIALFFNEFIQLHDLNSQLIISPPLDNAPDIKVKNKTLFIELDKKETLKQNTTYSINFGNAIQDLNENNPIENFKYIFSTGSYIDSLTVKGKVQNAFDHKTEKGILVMLYNDISDSAVYKSKPDYFAKTNVDGTFQINNVKNGNYKIVALKDANANYKYDEGIENIGFVEIPIDISEKKNILIDLFQEPAKKIYLKKHIHNEYGKIVFIFNQGSDGIDVLPLNTTLSKDQVILDFSKNNDTLTYWIKNFEKDSLKLQVKNGYKILDTVEFKMIKKEDALKARKNPLKLKLLNNFNGNQNFDLNTRIRLSFSQPIVMSNYEAMPFFRDTTKLYLMCIGFHKNDVFIGQWDSTHKAEDPNHPGVFVSAPLKLESIVLKENTKYHLFIPPGTFTDIFGLTNDTIKIDFKTREEKFYGSVKLKVTIPETKDNYIVQLLDDKENVVKEDRIIQTTTLTYEHLYPKNYKLKLIYDTNSNGKWDTGNYLRKIQPEKIIYYSEPMNIRSNWDLDLEWKVKD